MRFVAVGCAFGLILGALGCGSGGNAEKKVPAGSANGGSSTTSAGGGGVTSEGGSSIGGGSASGGAGGTGNGGASAGGTSGGTNAGGSDAAGGSGGSGGTGGGVGSTDYSPCPAAGTPCVILPFGDSISYGDGSTSHGGYREPLFHLVLSHSQSVTFVGPKSDGPDTVDSVPFPKEHAGYSGYKISDVSAFTADMLVTYVPQMVLLMIGTNDLAFNDDPPNAPERLGALMDIILDSDPDLLLVVAQIVPTKEDEPNVGVEALNAAIPELVQTRFDAGKHVAMVDMYGAFTANENYKTEYMFDKYHPSDAGYVKMADVWYEKIGSLLR